MSDFQSQSFLIRLVLGALGAAHPIRLAIGVAAGVILKIFLDGLAVSFPNILFLKAISAYQMYWFLIACSPLPFAPMLLGNRNAPESVVHKINTMQAILDRAKLSRVHEQMFWRTLLDKYVAAANTDLSRNPDLGKLFDESKAEIQIPNDQGRT
ncbi:hypothetical protein [Bradyrhizobium sp. SZCCHNPS1003]|uniref:hypothetical protein n=1 Tax=Bradyrhizobium sp. SZCCHNPS1003 TaxID=3057330 RepID=UPI0028E6D5F9|nr:hypothetical protein [Bradyrhizobium sp. SZCCHNPS1003]